MQRIAIALATILAFGPQEGAAQRPLFDDPSTMEITMRAPYRSMLANPNDRFDGTLIVEQAVPDSIPIGLTLRGKARVNAGICEFPGLMVFFDEGTQDTPFEGQGALPTVTHCNDRNSSEQLMLLEYHVYRAYKKISELALAVRLARITYIDVDTGRRMATRYAFFLEHWDHLAERSGWTYVRAPVIPPDAYDDSERGLFEVFQYMIGNTDWSFAFAAPDDDFCCHNAVPIGNPAGPVFPIPFDFDQAGLVNAPYAKPDATLEIRNVRQRLYRGICAVPSNLQQALDEFRESRTEIYAVFEDGEGLDNGSKNRTTRYLNEFYSTINDDGKVDREMSGKCREL